MEEKEILGVLGGALTSGLTDIAMEAVYESDPAGWEGKFPFIDLPWPLPPLDDAIVLGVSAVPAILGLATKNELATTIGVGMLAYAVPMFLHHIAIIAVRGPAARVTAQIIDDGLMPKYQKADGNPRAGLYGRVIARPKVIVGPYAGGIGARRIAPERKLQPKYQLGS